MASSEMESTMTPEEIAKWEQQMREGGPVAARTPRVEVEEPKIVQPIPHGTARCYMLNGCREKSCVAAYQATSKALGLS